MKDINDLWKSTLLACVICLVIGFIFGLIIGAL
jgi:hypothetical protein